MQEAVTGGNYGNNPYLNINFLNDQFTEAMKAQEKTAILAVISAKRATIASKGNTLRTALHQQSTEMKNLTSNTLTAGIKEGLLGKAADAADEYLTHTIKKPDLQSPIKGG
ncbi:hypothetical protein ACFO26_05985 [Lactococcus nasutitermitis]|uniref:Uncharacterized protein n=1 Tax=Lactococcus nasutitermitis TaxID=1652957 RepID=A0ABV9JCP9_9LACT|nr:hypothetical protein [Lactococcus nasutitermitis]